VYYRDLNNGPWLYTGDKHEYKPASLFKVPLMIAFFKEAAKRPELLQQEVFYETAVENQAQQNIDGTELTIEVGQTYTVQDLIERMIIYSDNSAAYLLLDQIDPQIVTTVFHDLDVPIAGVERSTSVFGPRTYASFLRVLYNGTYLNKEYSEKALEILSRTTFQHGMRAALEANTTASIKFGVAVNPDGSKQLHECGIVYWENTNPHLLCIMTTGDDYLSMASFIQSVTKEVQAAVSKKR
jgi:beta-lactamase class A